MPNGEIGQMYLLLKEAVTLRSFNCQQKITFSGTPTLGKFRIVLGAETTSDILFSATAADVKAALELFTAIDSVTVTGSISTTGLSIEFKGIQAATNVARLVISNNTLTKTGGTVNVTATVSYLGRGRDSLGVWLEGVSSDITIYASVQPLSGWDYQALPEGDRQREVLELYTKTPISQEQLIIRNGYYYEINKVEMWYGYYYSWIIKRKPD